MSEIPKLLGITANAHRSGLLLHIHMLRKTAEDVARRGEYALAIRLLRKSFAVQGARESHASKQRALARLWSQVQQHFAFESVKRAEMHITDIFTVLDGDNTSHSWNERITVLLQDLAIEIEGSQEAAYLIGTLSATVALLCDENTQVMDEMYLNVLQASFEPSLGHALS